jgi:hypothetical protein
MPPAALHPAEPPAKRWRRWKRDDIVAANHCHPRRECDSAAGRSEGEKRLLAAQFDPGVEQDAERGSVLLNLGTEAVAAHREEQIWFLKRFDERQDIPRSPAMAGGKRDKHLFFQQLPDFEASIGERQHDDGEIHCVGEHTRDGVIGA